MTGPLVRLRIERPASGGGVSHLGDGRVAFVRHALVGELVDARIVESTSRFVRAEALRVLEASVDRVPAPCPHAGPGACGGCDFQHASEQGQREWKSAVLEEHLARIGGVTRSISVTSVGPLLGYRTRLRCAVGRDGRLALRANRSHDLVDLDACLIVDDRLRPAFATNWSGASEVELRAIGEGEPFALVSGSTAHTGIRSLSGRALSPTTASRVRVGTETFHVSPASFWQAHRDAPRILSERVLEWARVDEGDTVVDLFCGVGLFTIPLARRVGSRGRVTGIEASAGAVRDARVNGEGLPLTFKQRTVTPRLIEQTITANDVVVLDPPRSGLARGVARSLAGRSPRRIVYVSCDGATLSRDLREFLGAGYALADLVAYDFFPMTEHVEVIALLDRGTERDDSESEGARPRPQ